MRKEFPILYKKANLLDKINQWQIIVEGDSYYTISGYTDGKQFQNEPTICTPKNLGKKNATTGEEQALAEATSMWQKRKDLGYWENINDINKVVVFSPMLAKDFTKEVKKFKFPTPLASSIKLDGVRCIVKEDGMWTRNGKQIISAPHIFESLKHLFENDPNLILDGELYTSNKDVDFNTIISCVRKTKPTQSDLELSKQYINYWVYDLPSSVNTYEYRVQELNELLHNIEEVKIVGFDLVTSLEEINKKLQEYIQNGYEGQMIRVLDSFYENKRSSGLLKHKNFKDDEFIILSVNEGIGKYSCKAATITIDVDGVEVDCTINGSFEYLEELWKNRESLIGKLASVRYFEKTVDGSLRFPKCLQIDRFDI